MEIIKLKDGTQLKILFITPGETALSGEKSMEIYVLLDDNTIENIESAFKNGNAERIEVGRLATSVEGNTETGQSSEETTTFELERVYEGYSEIKYYTVDRHFVYNIDQEAAIMRIILQEPNTSGLLKDIQSAIKRGLNQ